MTPRVWWPIAEVTLLSAWLGASILFSAAVAPALFATLPSRSLAGEVVGRVLPLIFYSGILIGLGVTVAETVRIGWQWVGPQSAGVLMVAGCAVAQFFIAPRIERIRAEIAGPIDALPLDDLRRVAFGRLHGISVAWLGVAIVAALAGLVLAARRIQTT